MRRLIYGASAREDLGQILAYITREARDRNVGAAFVAKLRGQCEKLSQLDATLGPNCAPTFAALHAKARHLFSLSLRRT